MTIGSKIWPGEKANCCLNSWQVVGATCRYHDGHKEFPFPTTQEWGEGEGEGHLICVVAEFTNPSPQPSPRSSLAGRGSQHALATPARCALAYWSGREELGNLIARWYVQSQSVRRVRL